MPKVGFYMTDDGVLRHGHVMGGGSISDRQQWHEADQFHRTDPYAHDDDESWDVNRVGWSSRDTNWRLTYDEKVALLTKYRNRYENNMRYAGYTPRGSSKKIEAPAPSYHEEPELEHAQPLPEEEKNEPLPAEENEPSTLVETEVESDPAEDEILELLTQLPDRVDTLERSVQSQGKRIDAQNTRIDNIAGTASSAQHATMNVASSVQALVTRIEAIENATVKQVEFVIRKDDQPERRIIGSYHPKFQKLIDLVTKLDHEDRNVWMAGPAGSGKTTAAMALADVLDLTYDFHPAIDMPHSLVGYMDAKGEYVSTAFRRVYENGGVILLDEVDASNPNALMVLNAALSGPKMSFPDRLVERHEDCVVLCAANTWGHGGTANYVGRFTQDDAFMDRFVYVDWQYDEAFERSLSLDDEWCGIVQTVRAKAVAQKAKLVISPRASIKGSKLLSRGMEPEDVVQAVFGRHRGLNDWPVIGAAAEAFAKKPRAQVQPTQPKPTQPSTNGLAKVDFTHVS